MNKTFNTPANAFVKKAVMLLPVVLILASAFTPPVKKSSHRKRQGTIAFHNDVISFGEVQPGKAYAKSITFTNTGTEPVRIYDCMSTCGAYVAEFPKKPVKPGESATIKVVYAPKSKYGFFSKSIIIESNSRNGYDYIYLQGTVAEPTNLAKN